MKILVLFAVGVLGCSLAGAAIVSKCDLMNKLKTAILKLPGNVSMSGLTSDDFVAKIVCHVEMGSKFNTSVVTKLSSDQGGSSEERGNMGRNNGGKHEENNGGKSEGNKGGNNGGNNGGNKGGNNGGKSEGNKGGNNGGKSEGNKGGNGGGHHRRRRSPFGGKSSKEADGDMTLYGLFQLCGDLVCNSTVNSTNLCNIECNNLIDDNIDDDISCVLMLLTEIVDKGFKAPNLMELRKVIRLIMQDDCNHVKASTYFAECQ